MAGDDVRLADVVVIDGHDYHTFQPLLYTLADAVRLTEHILERWEAADKDPALIEDGALNVVAVGGGPTGVESVGAIAELYRAIFVKDYPDIQQDKAQIVLVKAGPEIFTMFKPGLRKYARKALGGRDVEVLRGQVGVELQKANRIPVQPDLSVTDYPEVFAVGDIAWITDSKTDTVLPQLGSVALESGHHAGENITRLVEGDKTEPFKYVNKGTW